MKPFWQKPAGRQCREQALGMFVSATHSTLTCSHLEGNGVQTETRLPSMVSMLKVIADVLDMFELNGWNYLLLN